MDDTNEKKRSLNMEEKKNLQRLLFSDIESTVKSYDATRKEQRGQLKARLLENPPPELRALVDEHRHAEEVMARVKRELEQVGYVLTGYPDKQLDIPAYNKQPQELATFDAETSRTEKRMADLKRDFTLRLFAGGEEARALFATLGDELTSIIK